METADSGRLVSDATAVGDTTVTPDGAGVGVAVPPGDVPMVKLGKVPDVDCGGSPEPDVTESAIGLVGIAGELVIEGPLITVPDTPVGAVTPLIVVTVPPVADTPLTDTGVAVPANPEVVWPGVTPLSVGVVVPANPVVGPLLMDAPEPV